MAAWNVSGSQELSSSCGNCCHAHLQVKFGLSLNETLYDEQLPSQLVDMLVYIARDGATTTDIFRQPGSTADVAVIVADLTAGRLVDFTKYNFYALASVAKKFLLKIPGGLFGAEVENRLFDVLRLNSRAKKYESINCIITQLSLPTQQLLSLLLGTWFRIVNHSEYNTMSSDAVAKNVAAYVFHSIGSDVGRLQTAIQLLQILIDDFSVVNMLGAKNIQYFTDVSRTRVSAEQKRRGDTFASPTLCSVTDNHFSNIATSSCSFVSPRASLGHPTETIVQVFPPTPSTPPPRCSPSTPQHGSNLWVQPQLNPKSSMSAPDVNKTLASPSHNLLSSGLMSSSLNRFDGVKQRQLMRLKRRSHWFLSPNSSANYRFEIPHETSSLIGTDDAKASQPATRNISASSFNDTILSNSSFCQPESDSFSTCGAESWAVEAYSVKNLSINSHRTFSTSARVCVDNHSNAAIVQSNAVLT